MRRTAHLAAAAVAAIIGIGPLSAAAKDDSPPPKVFVDLLACRSTQDTQARLACYDQAAAALEAAERKQDIVIADRKDVRELRRGLFGYAVPAGKLTGLGKGQDGEELNRVETKVTAVTSNRAGRLRLIFADVGTWDQTDINDFAISPKVGQAAWLEKGALGSYFVSVNKQPPIKMRRVE